MRSAQNNSNFFNFWWIGTEKRVLLFVFWQGQFMFMPLNPFSVRPYTQVICDGIDNISLFILLLPHVRDQKEKICLRR